MRPPSRRGEQGYRWKETSETEVLCLGGLCMMSLSSMAEVSGLENSKGQQQLRVFIAQGLYYLWQEDLGHSFTGYIKQASSKFLKLFVWTMFKTSGWVNFGLVSVGFCANGSQPAVKK